MSLKAARQKVIRERKRQRTAAKKPDPVVLQPPPLPPREPLLSNVGPDPEMMRSINAKNEQIAGLLSQLSRLLSRNIEVDVSAGSVEVAMPERPSSLTIEFDDGRTATVTPNYEV